MNLPPAPPALLAPADAARDPGAFAAYLEDQGATGGCGTTSLAMVLSYWRGTPGWTSRQALDRTCRRVDVGLTPGIVVRQARRLGWRAAAAQARSVADLRPWLDAGAPVILLIENGPRRGSGRLHFVVALALKPDAAGRPAALRLADPQGGTIRDMPLAELAWRWRRLRAGAIATGLDRSFTVVLPAPATPVLGAGGQVRSSAALGLPAPAAFDWRVAAFERYLGAANTFGPPLEVTGLRFWYW